MTTLTNVIAFLKTGDTRAPKKGEWFHDSNGCVVQSAIDCDKWRVEILTPIPNAAGARERAGEGALRCGHWWRSSRSRFICDPAICVSVLTAMYSCSTPAIRCESSQPYSTSSPPSQRRRWRKHRTSNAGSKPATNSELDFVANQDCDTAMAMRARLRDFLSGTQQVRETSAVDKPPADERLEENEFTMLVASWRAKALESREDADHIRRTAKVATGAEERCNAALKAMGGMCRPIARREGCL